MKEVLISIQPKWCELIVSGKKTVEVRKTKPKIETPFKVYIYCTKGKPLMKTAANSCFIDNSYIEGQNLYGLYELVNGKVIGEFVCDKIENIEIRHFTVFGHENRYTAVGENPDYQWLKKSCLSYDEVVRYGKLAPLYGWHISDLVIYDKPRELNEFYTICPEYDKDEPICDGCDYEHTVYCGADCPPYFECKCEGRKPLKRPPQSWCYVEGGE